MKKTILALTVTTLFSGAALANHTYVDAKVANEISNAISSNTKTDINGNLVSKDGTFKYGTVTQHEDGRYEIETVDGTIYRQQKDGTISYVDTRNDESGTIEIINTSERNNDQNNHDAEREKAKAEDAKKRHEWEQKRRDNGSMNDQKNHDAERIQAKADNIAKAIDYAIDNNKEVVINGETYGSKELFEAKNMLASMSKEDRAALVKALETPDTNQIDVKVKDAKENGGSNDVMEVEGAINEAIEGSNADVKAAQNWAAQAEAQFKQEVARLDSKIDTVEGRVSNGAAMTGAMSQMQFGRDGLGLGAGVAEFNGSRAVAVGVGYAFGSEKQWMAKGSFGYAESKKGKGSKDTMAAAGITYSFK